MGWRRSRYLDLAAWPRPARERADERVLMAWLLGGGFIVSGLLGLLSMVLPHYSLVDEAAVTATSAAAIAIGVGTVALRRRLPPLAHRAFVAIGVGAVTIGLAASGDPRTDTELFYVYPLLFAFYFFRWWEAALIWGLGVCLCTIVVMDLDPGTPVVSLVIFAVVLGVNGGVIALLRERSRRLLEAIGENARTDPLTGLLNRRGFQVEVEHRLTEAGRQGLPFALIVADLDDFKGVNDRLGHLGGDMALERVAAAMSHVQRVGDLSARMGGEEFAVALPGATGADGIRIAERLRLAIEEALAVTPAPITCSVGVASFPAHGSSLEQLMRAADFALYAAKDAGKNRTVLYDDGLRESIDVPDSLPGDWPLPHPR